MKPTRLLLASVLALLVSVSAFAQDAPPDPFETARFRFGGFAFTPGLDLKNLGYDTNVFNSWDNPQGDFTFTIVPQADAWVRMGKARATIHGAVGYVYFATYDTERSWNTDDSIRLDLPLNHLRPYGGYSYLNVRDRPGYEIDARVRRTENSYFAGADVPLTRKTTLGATIRQTQTDYAQGQDYNGSNLAFQYNRDTNVATAYYRYALTPLTTLLLDLDYVQERFVYNTIRDSNGFRLVPGIEFKPFAVIGGSARVGFRQLNFFSPVMPDFTGLVAAVDLGYTVMGATRLGVRVDRDVQYSYEVGHPYYVQTGLTLTVTHRLTNTWDMQARGGTQRLSYKSAIPADPSVPQPPDRTDNVDFFGGGVGYLLGTDLRLGLNVDYYTRRSQVITSQYEGLRVGTSVTYGF